MARTEITVQDIQSHDGKVISLAAGDSTNDHQFDNDGKTLLYIKNGAVAVIVTVVGVQDANRRKVDLVLTVAATKEAILGPFPFELFGQAGGKVFVDLDDDSNVEVGVIRQRN